MSVDLDILSWLDKEEPVTPTQVLKSTKTDSLTTPDVAGTCFEIQREVLVSLLERAISIVPTKDIIPVLNNFQFHVKDSELKIIASSGKLSIVMVTDQVTTKVEGVEVFPARTLLNIVKECSSNSIVYIEATSSGAVIVSGGFSAEIAMPSGKGFPVMDDLTGVTFHEVNRTDFINAVNTVKYALPDKDYSGQSGMKMINIKSGKFTACDGSRFQQVRVENFNLNMKLPALCISSLLKILSSTDMETIEIGETTLDKLVFRLGPTVFYVNKLADPYPNVEQLWLRPALSNDQVLLVNRAELITAIKQVRFAVEGSASNAVGLVLQEDQLTVVAKGINKSSTTVIGCTWKGKPRTIAVNCLHLAEMLKAYPHEQCKFMLDDDTQLYRSPILLKDEDSYAIATISQLLSYRAGVDS
jgi:DNA polymerase III sliding clamp (beta) subunit (PCNA family)